MAKVVSYKQWQNVYSEHLEENEDGSTNIKWVKTDIVQKTVTGTVANLINKVKLLFRGGRTDYLLHRFNYLWQGEQFELLLQKLAVREVSMVMDFAKNVVLQHQQEIQYFWFRESIMMHPCVVFWNPS